MLFNYINTKNSVNFAKKIWRNVKKMWANNSGRDFYDYDEVKLQYKPRAPISFKISVGLYAWLYSYYLHSDISRMRNKRKFRGIFSDPWRT